MALKLVIGYNSKQDDTNTYDADTYLMLDVVESKRVSSDSVIASFPIQNGDVISDHMYRNPSTYTVSGQFGINGNNYDDSTYTELGDSNDRLTAIQNVFENIKNNAWLCTLITMDVSGNNVDATSVASATTRFKVRKNMALKRVDWDEKYNSMGFTLEFYEVIIVTDNTYYNMSPEVQDSLNLPNVSYPVGTSLSSVISETDDIQLSVLKLLYDRGYMEDEFVKEVLLNSSNYGEYYALSVAFGAIGAVATAAGIATYGALAGTAAAAGPVGWIVLGVAALGTGIYFLIKSAIEKNEANRKAEKVFKIRNGSAKQDADRLAKLLNDVKTAVDQIKSNAIIYQISNNSEQQVMLKVNGNIYALDFTKNNTTKNSNPWTATVSKISNGSTMQLSNTNFAVVSDFTNLNSNKNVWFRDGNYDVYIMNPSLNSNLNTPDKRYGVMADLTTYQILVCNGEVETIIKKISQTIIDVLDQGGYIE